MQQSLVDFFPRPLHCKGAVRLSATADQARELLGNVGDNTIAKDFIDKIEVFGEGVGAIRHLHLANGGGVIVEPIEEYDAADRYYDYRVIDAGIHNFTNYLAMARVTPAGNDSGIVFWNTLAQPVNGHEDVAQAMLQGNMHVPCRAFRRCQMSLQ